MIVWLASYPRSGNTFARLVLQQLYDVCLPTAYEQNVAKTAAPQPAARPVMFPELRNNITLEEARQAAEPMLVKTHDLPSDNGPAIYLARDGRDALVSHAHYVLDFDRNAESPSAPKFAQTLRALIESDGSFGGWGNNVLAWTSRNAPTVVICFEDLIATPVAALRAAVDGLQLKLVQRPNYTIPQFSTLQTRAPKFFRRGGVGAWRDELPDDLHKLFWQRHGAAMNALGYQRDEDSPVANRRITSAA